MSRCLINIYFLHCQVLRVHAYACHGDYCNIWILFRCSDMCMYVMLSKSWNPFFQFTLRFSLCLCPPPVYLTTCTFFSSLSLMFYLLSLLFFFLYLSFSRLQFLFLSSISLSFSFADGKGLLDKAETQNRKIQFIIMIFNCTCQAMCFVLIIYYPIIIFVLM